MSYPSYPGTQPEQPNTDPYSAPSGQPAYGAYAPVGSVPVSPAPVVTAGPVPKRTGPVTMLVLSIVGLIVAPIIMVVGVMVPLMDIATTAVTVDSGGQVHLTAGDKMITPALAAGNTPNSESLIASCTLVGDNGSTVFATRISGMGDLPIYTVPADGNYLVDCPYPQVSIMKAINLDALGEFVAPVIIGMVVGFVAFVCLIISIVWLVKRNKAIKLAKQGAYPQMYS
ncbi:hypothetical protein [Buchananella felis]|uniref:hypothetical protein n=1 Tax=Buchananella felis TaxID=3231492 RepID=UPI0035283D41